MTVVIDEAQVPPAAGQSSPLDRHPHDGDALAARLVCEHIRGPEATDRDALFSTLAAASPVLPLPGGMFVVTGAEHVRKAAAAPALVIGQVAFPADVVSEAPDFVRFFTNTLSFLDRTDHHRLRRILSGHFTPKGVAAVRPALTGVVQDLTADVLGRTGPVDFVADYCDVLPMRAMGLLLGVPADEWAAFAAAGRAMLARIAWSFPHLHPQDSPITNDEFVRLHDRVEALLDEDVPHYSLTASLRHAVDAGRLDRLEATRLMLLLFMTGIDTVSASLATTVLTLHTDEQALAAWLAGRTATGDVLTEALRLRPPLPFASRTADAGLRLDGVDIPAGSTVLLCPAAADRDPARFEAPGTWAPGGRGPALTFGHGTYRCLGAVLAMQELECALESLRPHGVSVIDSAAITWRSDISFHTPTRMPAVLGAGWGPGRAASERTPS